jgi:hypothetical protein
MRILMVLKVCPFMKQLRYKGVRMKIVTVRRILRVLGGAGLGLRPLYGRTWPKMQKKELLITNPGPQNEAKNVTEDVDAFKMFSHCN